MKGLGRTYILSFIVCCCLLVLFISACDYKVPGNRRFITDSHGRALILHAANVALGFECFINRAVY